MSQAKSESDRKDKVIRALSLFAIILLGLVMHAHFLLATLPKEFECHFPPDLSKGGSVKVNATPRHEVYAFALMIYQQTYRCEYDCAVDFNHNLRRYGYFFSDAYRLKLLKQAKALAGHNRRRVRSIAEFGRYAENKVVPQGNGVWVVFLDVLERELIGGKPVRKAVMRYPLIIARSDVDREKNPWRLVIEGLRGQPQRLQ